MIGSGKWKKRRSSEEVSHHGSASVEPSTDNIAEVAAEALEAAKSRKNVESSFKLNPSAPEFKPVGRVLDMEILEMTTEGVEVLKRVVKRRMASLVAQETSLDRKVKVLELLPLYKQHYGTAAYVLSLFNSSSTCEMLENHFSDEIGFAESPILNQVGDNNSTVKTTEPAGDPYVMCLNPDATKIDEFIRKVFKALIVDEIQRKAEATKKSDIMDDVSVIESKLSISEIETSWRNRLEKSLPLEHVLHCCGVSSVKQLIDTIPDITIQTAPSQTSSNSTEIHNSTSMTLTGIDEKTSIGKDDQLNIIDLENVLVGVEDMISDDQESADSKILRRIFAATCSKQSAWPKCAEPIVASALPKKQSNYNIREGSPSMYNSTSETVRSTKSRYSNSLESFLPPKSIRPEQFNRLTPLYPSVSDYYSCAPSYRQTMPYYDMYQQTDFGQPSYSMPFYQPHAYQSEFQRPSHFTTNPTSRPIDNVYDGCYPRHYSSAPSGHLNESDWHHYSNASQQQFAFPKMNLQSSPPPPPPPPASFPYPQSKSNMHNNPYPHSINKDAPTSPEPASLHHFLHKTKSNLFNDPAIPNNHLMPVNNRVNSISLPHNIPSHENDMPADLGVDKHTLNKLLQSLKGNDHNRTSDYTHEKFINRQHNSPVMLNSQKTNMTPFETLALHQAASQQVYLPNNCLQQQQYDETPSFQKGTYHASNLEFQSLVTPSEHTTPLQQQRAQQQRSQQQSLNVIQRLLSGTIPTSSNGLHGTNSTAHIKHRGHMSGVAMQQRNQLLTSIGDCINKKQDTNSIAARTTATQGSNNTGQSDGFYSPPNEETTTTNITSFIHGLMHCGAKL